MLREVWLNIGIKKIDTYEGIMVKVLLDSGATEMFMDKRMAAKHGFRLQKLERLITVVTLYKCLGKISDIFHHNNQNNWLKRRARPSQRCSLRRPVMDSSMSSRVVAVTTTTYTS